LGAVGWIQYGSAPDALQTTRFPLTIEFFPIRPRAIVLSSRIESPARRAASAPIQPASRVEQVRYEIRGALARRAHEIEQA